MILRLGILSACFLLSAVLVAGASKTEQVPVRESLANFPLDVGEWRGRRLPDFEAGILDVLGVDEYVNRMYQSRDGLASLYIGYYQSQRQGDTIHSPMNCLPGSGWEPLSRSYLSIPVGTETPITVNRYVIQKGLDRQVVLYWYQSHGRIVANEYRSKIFMVYDAVRLNRTDAALVRVVSARIGTDAAAEDRASGRAVAFVKAMFPLLDRYLPS
jgi:EpsI family protein